MTEQYKLNCYDYALEKGAQFSIGKTSVEWIGRCIMPGCSSKTDAFSVQPEGKLTGCWAGYGAWMCRKCWDPSEIVFDSGVPRKRGWGTIVDMVMRFENMSYPEAEAFVLAREGKRPSFTPGMPSRSPAQAMTDELWLDKYVPYLVKSVKTDKDGIALAYCVSRGLKPETVSTLKYGYSVDPVKMRDGSFRDIPFLVIPWHKEDGSLYRKINRRNLHHPLPDDEDKYRLVQGSLKDELYLGYMLKQHKRPTFLVESELDAATLWQGAGDLVNVVATGSVDHGRSITNESRLRRQPFVFVAFDADKSGEEASQCWLSKLDKAKSIRYRPLAHDPNDMHIHGPITVRKWVQDALAYCLPGSPAKQYVSSLPVLDDPPRNLHYKQRVLTPLGPGEVLTVRYFETLGRTRCSVFLDDFQHDDTKWAVFNASLVLPIG